MLAIDISALNEIDTQIQDAIVQLNDLLVRRNQITSGETKPARKTKRSKKIDFSSIDLSLHPHPNLSIGWRGSHPAK